MPKGVPSYGSIYAGKFEVGMQFSRWIVIDSTIQKRRSNASVLVRCECGTERLVQCNALLKGKSNGCECVISGNKSAHWTGTFSIPGKYLTSIKNAAIKRGIEWTVTNNYLQQLIDTQCNICALSGEPIQFTRDRATSTASLDRIDSFVGYIEGNVQWVHKNVNVMKNVFNQKEFIHWCKKINDYSGNQQCSDGIRITNGTGKLFRGSKPHS